MLPPTKLQVSNIVMTPSNMLRVLQHLEDYYHKNITKVPKNDEWPGPNLFYRDTFNFKTLQAVTSDHHRLQDVLRDVKPLNKQKQLELRQSLLHFEDLSRRVNKSNYPQVHQTCADQ